MLACLVQLGCKLCTIGVMPRDISVQLLSAHDLPLARQALALLGDVFGEPAAPSTKCPSDDYLQQLLGSKAFVAIVALGQEGQVLGALLGYVLPKLEQMRSEFYLYDLAVAQSHRRQGIATAMINTLRSIAHERGVYVIFVQADIGDDAAIKLYSKLGTREDVLHFDIAPASHHE